MIWCNVLFSSGRSSVLAMDQVKGSWKSLVIVVKEVPNFQVDAYQAIIGFLWNPPSPIGMQTHHLWRWSQRGWCHLQTWRPWGATIVEQSKGNNNFSVALFGVYLVNRPIPGLIHELLVQFVQCECSLHADRSFSDISEVWHIFRTEQRQLLSDMQAMRQSYLNGRQVTATAHSRVFERNMKCTQTQLPL